MTGEAIIISLIQHFEADSLWINPENVHPCIMDGQIHYIN